MSFNSFIWPFVTIFISEQTQLALSFTTLMFTFQASASILTVGKTSRFMDLYGRKKMMVLGLILHAVTLLLMSEATSILSWIILMFFPQSKICGLFITSIFPILILGSVYIYLFYYFFISPKYFFLKIIILSLEIL